MSKEDLIPIKDHERAIELGRKGGISKGTTKQVAAHLREAKKKGNIIGYMMELAKTTDPLEAFSWMLENYALQYELIEQENNLDKKFTKRDKLLQRFEVFLKLRFGETQRTFYVDASAQFQDNLEAWRRTRMELYRNIQTNNKSSPATSNSAEQDYTTKEQEQ